jgi:hypothetical protein
VAGRAGEQFRAYSCRKRMHCSGVRNPSPQPGQCISPHSAMISIASPIHRRTCSAHIAFGPSHDLWGIASQVACRLQPWTDLHAIASPQPAMTSSNASVGGCGGHGSSELWARGAIACLLHGRYLERLDTDYDLRKAWCAILGLNHCQPVVGCSC